MSTAVLIVAAGSGNRFGGEIPKQFQKLGGKSVLSRTIRAFAGHPGVDLVQVVIGAGHEQLYGEALDGMTILPPVLGGATRQISVRRGLEALASHRPERVLIHDAARPFVPKPLISHVISALDRYPAVLPASPIADTLKRAEGMVVRATVERTGLWAAQTPQGFHFDPILDAHRRAAQMQTSDFTDDAAIAEWAGLEVTLVAGDPGNRKITLAQDLAEAEQRIGVERMIALGDIRVGQGFDVHEFVSGDSVTLCGVKIPHSHRLSGHSDADAPLHALTDAILGAIGEGDIGVHFPPSDPQWKGVDSAVFLRHAANLLSERGGIVSHIDITIVAEAPKIAPHVAAMRRRLEEILGLAGNRIAIKATTSEKLGFTGRREGLVAFATATIRLPWSDDA